VKFTEIPRFKILVTAPKHNCQFEGPFPKMGGLTPELHKAICTHRPPTLFAERIVALPADAHEKFHFKEIHLTPPSGRTERGRGQVTPSPGRQSPDVRSLKIL